MRSYFNKKDITFCIADDTHAGLVAAFVGEHGAEDALGNQLFQNGPGPVVFETYYRSSSPAYNADFPESLSHSSRWFYPAGRFLSAPPCRRSDVCTHLMRCF